LQYSFTKNDFMSTNKWEGVFPAMLTPFTADDKIDFALFEKNVKAQVEAGIEGLILGGSLGEGSTLDGEEKNSCRADHCGTGNQGSRAIGKGR
jgi:dihydrodipicolinate synthase/N-acetylneuraminate lyase